MSKIATRLRIAPFSLVRRQAERWEENMVAGESDDKGNVKVYKYDGTENGQLVYRFFKKFKPDELRVVGAYLNQPAFMPKLRG